MPQRSLALRLRYVDPSGHPVPLDGSTSERFRETLAAAHSLVPTPDASPDLQLWHPETWWSVIHTLPHFFRWLTDIEHATTSEVAQYAADPFAHPDVLYRAAQQLARLLNATAPNLEPPPSPLPEPAHDTTALTRHIRDLEAANASLHIQLDWFRNIAELSSDFGYELALDPETGGMHLTYLDPRFLQLTGYAYDDFTDAEGWWFIIHEDDCAEAMEQFRRNMEGCFNAQSQIRIRIKSGEVRHLRTRTECIRDPETNKVIGFRGVAVDVTAEQEALQAHQNSQEKYHLLVEQAADAIFVSEPDGRIVEANGRALTLTGYSREELLGMTLSDIVEPGAFERDPIDYTALASGETVLKERTIIRKDSAPRSAEVSARLLPGGRLQGIVRDITARKEAQAAVEANEHLLEGILTASLDAILAFEAIRDADGAVVDFRCRLANPRSTDFLGRSSADLPGRPLTEALPPILSDYLLRSFKGVLETGEPLNEIQLAEHLADTRWHRLMVVRVDDGVALTARDVTESKLARRALIESERRYRTLVENAPDAIVVLDVATGTFVDVNDTATRFFKLSREELLQTHPVRLSPPVQPNGEPSSTMARRMILAALSGATPDFEWIHLDATGNEMPCEIRLVRLPHSKRVLIRGNLTDITERKKSEAALVQAKEEAEQARAVAEAMNRLKSTFLSNMSHEIRTPLTSILGFTAILREEANLEPLHRDLLALIARSGDRLLATINSVLDLSMLESGMLNLNPVSLDLGDTVEEMVQLFQTRADERGLVMKTHLPADAQAIHHDPLALQRILNNLLSNAIKFTEHGSITIHARACTERIELRVTDTGIGIDPAFMPHLFDEFMQESDGTARTHEGTGIGLAVTRRLIEMMNGEIEIQSAQGHGTTVTVTLPRSISRL